MVNKIALSFDVTVPVPHQEAIEQVTEALRGEGFGVLTRIDAHNIFEQKLGLAFHPYTILGACNPQLAHRALSHRAAVGLLLPCNVTVEATESGGGTTVRIANPEAMLAGSGIDGDPAMTAVMADARERLARVAEAIG